MATPVAYFNFSGNGLAVTFTNLSAQVVAATTWAWDFGDGSTSTVKNPVRSYSAAGFYIVSLTATNPAPGNETNNFTISIGVNATGIPTLNNLNLLQLVALNSPSTITLNNSQVVQLIRLQQEFIHPLVTPAVASTDIYLETAYPPLANMLISILVTIDLINQGANAYLMGLGNQTGGSGNEVKKITTGPSDAEWFSGSETWFNMMKPGGVLDQTQKRACSLAARLRIPLPFCPALPQTPFVPQVTYPCPPPTNISDINDLNNLL